MKQTYSQYAAPALALIALSLGACGGGGSSSGAGAPRTPVTTANYALKFTAATTGGSNYTQGSYLQGFAFTANSAITVTKLGAFDSNYNIIGGVGAETFESTPVGLYDITTGTLLGQVTVTVSDPVTGFFHYHALANDITLNTTDTYAVVWVSGSNYYTAFPPYNFNFDSSITFAGYAGVGAGNLTNETTLTLPTVYSMNTAYGSLIENLGPNFIFTK